MAPGVENGCKIGHDSGSRDPRLYVNGEAAEDHRAMKQELTTQKGSSSSRGPGCWSCENTVVVEVLATT